MPRRFTGSEPSSAWKLERVFLDGSYVYTKYTHVYMYTKIFFKKYVHIHIFLNILQYINLIFIAVDLPNYMKKNIFISLYIYIYVLVVIHVGLLGVRDYGGAF